MIRTSLIAAFYCAALCFGVLCSAPIKADDTFCVVVMDPMAAPLACDCVQGYAQRKYEKLGAYLEQKLSRPVQVYWSGSLTSALKEHGIQADLVIGKHSVVLSDARQSKLNLRPIAQLANQDGSLTQTGLIVVRKDDTATDVAGLAGYRIFFGPEDCDEKNLAPRSLLKKHGVTLPATLEISDACSTAAAKLMELPADENAAAVISSYAAPLLEGCGTIKKGDLRIIGTTEPVPFISAFVNSAANPDQTRQLQAALLDVELNPELLVALETSLGFVAWTEQPASKTVPSPEGVSDEPEASKKKS